MDGGSARHKAATQHKHGKTAHKHPYLEWESNPRSQCSGGRRRFMSQTAQTLGSTEITIDGAKDGLLIQRLSHSCVERLIKCNKTSVTLYILIRAGIAQSV
jgi:hypothetical protein